MYERNLYELIIVAVIMLGMMVVVFIVQFVLIISGRNYAREKDEANQKRYKDIAEQNELLIKKAGELIIGANEIFKKL